MTTNPKTPHEAAEEALGAENVADFEAQIAALRADIARLSEVLAAMASTGSQNIQDAARQAFADLKAKGEEAADQATGAMDDVTDSVRRHPLQSLGIAAGAGMLIGLLMGRR
ncbi:MAG: DUF883 domain-containing protein [bacterium]